MKWRCIETGRLYADTAWLRLKFRFWTPVATRWPRLHRVLRHYELA